MRYRLQRHDGTDCSATMVPITVLRMVPIQRYRQCHQIPSLTDGDIQICCLIKLRFSNGDIANMLAISPTSVSKRKLRLKERIVQEIGSLGENQSLDLWLMEY